MCSNESALVRGAEFDRTFALYRAGAGAIALNLASGPHAAASAKIDLSRADRIDDDQFNRLLWRTIKGAQVLYPEPRRISLQEIARGR
jgi:hypothetical protein